MNNQQYPQNNYADIRQIIQDAVTPIKELLDRVQLTQDRIYDSLGKEFLRKDVYEAEQLALRKDYEEFKKDTRSRTSSALLRLSIVMGIVVGILTALSLLHVI